jgi:hypothetical protein
MFSFVIIKTGYLTEMMDIDTDENRHLLYIFYFLSDKSMS